MSNKKLAPPERQRFDEDDIEAIATVLREQNELWPYKLGPDNNGDPIYWNKFREYLEEYYRNENSGPNSVVPTSSGTASIHVALGGLEIPPGSEVIVPPITDMGTIMPVLFQNCIPIFADVDPNSGLLTADTIQQRITKRTKAVIVVHLTGSPADMEPITKLCQSEGIAVIEDCAQALGATYNDVPVGMLSNAGAFSLNSWKHVTAGEGGYITIPGDMKSDQFSKSQLFADKYRDRLNSNNPEYQSYYGSGLNYRMSDLELALAISQFKKVDEITQEYTRLGRHLDNALSKVPGIVTQQHHAKATPVYFFAWFRLITDDERQRDNLISKLLPVVIKLGMFLGESYGREPMYAHPVFQNKNFFPTTASGKTVWPAEMVARDEDPSLPDDAFDYPRDDCESDKRCPNAEMWCRNGFGLYFNESHKTAHLDAFVAELDANMRTLV